MEDDNHPHSVLLLALSVLRVKIFNTEHTELEVFHRAINIVFLRLFTSVIHNADEHFLFPEIFPIFIEQH